MSAFGGKADIGRLGNVRPKADIGNRPANHSALTPLPKSPCVRARFFVSSHCSHSTRHQTSHHTQTNSGIRVVIVREPYSSDFDRRRCATEHEDHRKVSGTNCKTCTVKHELSDWDY